VFAVLSSVGNRYRNGLMARPQKDDVKSADRFDDECGQPRPIGSPTFLVGKESLAAGSAPHHDVEESIVEQTSGAMPKTA